MSTLVLLDTSNIVYRSYYGLNPNMFIHEGEHVNAIYGCARQLMNVPKVVKKGQITIVACCDSKKENLERRKENQEYKTNRYKAPTSLFNQFCKIYSLFDAFDIQTVQIDGFEADDVIASIAANNVDKFDEILIFSTDKDFCQLLDNDKISIYDFSQKTMKNNLFVQEKFKVNPKDFTLYQAFVGDKCDNIRGIPRIGPKTAVKIINGPEKLKSEMLDKHKEQLEKNLNLVTLRQDLNISLSLNRYTLGTDKQKEFLNSLNFQSLIKQLK